MILHEVIDLIVADHIHTAITSVVERHRMRRMSISRKVHDHLALVVAVHSGQIVPGIGI